MKTSTILNVALAIALVFLCYKLAVTEGKRAQKQETSEVVLNNILERTSVRSYLDKSIEDDKIEKLLRAGMAAPTAVNKQPGTLSLLRIRVCYKSLLRPIPTQRWWLEPR